VSVESSQNTELKGVIKHKLTYTYVSSGLKLLKSNVLLSKGLKASDPRSATKLLQRQLQFQYLRLIEKQGLKSQDLLRATYALNCCPVGFLANPVTRLCMKPLICPWCFVRLRLQPIYDLVTGYTPEKLANLRLVGWFRPFTWGQSLPFFDRRAGPHLWYSAAATAQYVVPSVTVTEDTSSLIGCHFGVQLLPDKYQSYKDIVQHLEPKNTGISHVWFYRYASEDALLKLLEQFATKIDWTALCRPQAFDVFQRLHGNAEYSKAQLCRIQKFNLKVKNG
jgi:hypothetical protein